MRVIDAAAVRELLDGAKLVDAVADAMADLSLGRASVPPRCAARVGEAGLLATMPAYCPALGVLAAKLLTVYPGNHAAALPTHQATILAFDPADGRLLAAVEGELLTAARTAACSALSVRLLARPDSRVLAVLGTGPQARAHALYCAVERPFDQVLVGGRDPAKAGALAEDLREAGLPARACGIDDAVTAADVVCAATSTLEPLLHAGNVRPGTHVASVGYSAAGREVDPDLLLGSLVVVEHRETTFQPFPVGVTEVSELVAAGSLHGDDVVEIGELVAGVRPGRAGGEQVTVYRSMGLAAQDVAAVAVVLAAASGTGAGVDVAL